MDELEYSRVSGCLWHRDGRFFLRRDAQSDAHPLEIGTTLKDALKKASDFRAELTYEHVFGILWRLAGVYYLRRDAQSDAHPLEIGTTLKDALKKASFYEANFTKVRQSEGGTLRAFSVEGQWSHWGEAWSRSPGKELVASLQLDVSALSDKQLRQLAHDCYAIEPPKLPLRKQNTAEIVKVEKALATTERLLVHLGNLGPAPAGVINPTYDVDPMLGALAVQKALNDRQRELIWLRESPSGELKEPERHRLAFVENVASIYLRWTDDESRDPKELGMSRVSDPSKYLNSTNKDGYFLAPFFVFLENLQQKLRLPLNSEDPLRTLYSTQLNRKPYATTAVDVLTRVPNS